jgi:hypothetical protein
VFLPFLHDFSGEQKMNLLDFIQKEFKAAWDEVNRPLFPESYEDEYFYTELFNYYHSLKGKTIDTSNGESLFPITVDNPYSINKQHVPITKAQSLELSELPVLAGSR